MERFDLSHSGNAGINIGRSSSDLIKAIEVGNHKAVLFSLFERYSTENIQINEDYVFDSSFIADLALQIPETIDRNNRTEYFNKYLPLELSGFGLSGKNSELKNQWTQFIYLIRRSVEKQFLGEAIYRFSEPIDKKGLDSRAFGYKETFNNKLGFMSLI